MGIVIFPSEISQRALRDAAAMRQLADEARSCSAATSRVEVTAELHGSAWEAAARRMRGPWSAWWDSLADAAAQHADACEELARLTRCFWGETARVSEDDLRAQIERVDMLRNRAAAYPRVQDSSDWSLSRTKIFLEERITKIYEYRQASAGIFAETEAAIRAAGGALERLGYVPSTWQSATFDPAPGSQSAHDPKEAFVTSMQAEFGFDAYTAGLMWKVYEHLVQEDEERRSALVQRWGEGWTRATFRPVANRRFFAIMASSVYNGPKWNLILGYDFDFQYPSGVLPGLSAKESDFLAKQIRNQHVEISSTGATQTIRNDFAHLCATAATILKEDGPVDQLAALYAAQYNGVISIDAQAGYVGDAMGTNGATPSMGPADYKADLDAVNLARRLQQSNKPLPSILGEYYSEIETGKGNRAEEFVENIGWETLEQQRETFIAHTALQIQMENPARFNEADPLEFEQAQKDALAAAKEQASLYDAFLQNLKEGNNEMEE